MKIVSHLPALLFLGVLSCLTAVGCETDEGDDDSSAGGPTTGDAGSNMGADGGTGTGGASGKTGVAGDTGIAGDTGDAGQTSDAGGAGGGEIGTAGVAGEANGTGGADAGSSNAGGSHSANGGSSSSRPSWVGDGECRVTSTTTCSEYTEKPYAYRCVLAAMENIGPEEDCVNPTTGTLSGAAWCCPNPLCTRTTTTDYVCTDSAKPSSYSCPADSNVPNDCVAITSDTFCCP